ncbi:DUF4085 family protein [Abyssisolibacter fermentans]|uniref:DUF4085 family protein n=1 Tax=Abyssisolibacter fermentans TaxID=1766203 RepID=UPI00082D291E|nr:DUF4085 family protein [Abyssisolibacter fermentans]
MKFLTRDLYKKLCLTSIAIFDSRKEALDYKQKYGIDIKDEIYKNFENIIRFIPGLLDYVDNKGELYYDGAPSDEFCIAMMNFQYKLKFEWIRICREYNKHYNNIKSKLSNNVQKLAIKNIHDFKLTNVKKKNNEVALVLNGGCSYSKDNEKDNVNIIFGDIKNVNIPENYHNKRCIFSEIHLSNIGQFEYRILLDEGEIHIIADNVDML